MTQVKCRISMCLEVKIVNLNLHNYRRKHNALMHWMVAIETRLSRYTIPTTMARFIEVTGASLESIQGIFVFTSPNKIGNLYISHPNTRWSIGELLYQYF